jgi:hypothetical protein
VPQDHHLEGIVTEIGKTTVVVVTGARWHPDPTLVTNELAKYVLTEAPGWVIVRHGACPGENSIDQAVHEWVKDCGEWLGVIEDAMPADWDHCHADCPTTRNHRVKKAPGDIYHPGKRPDYCTYAGPRRNADMFAKSPVDLVIAGPYGPAKGTRNCVSQARKAGIPAHRIRIMTVPKNQPANVLEPLF